MLGDKEQKKLAEVEFFDRIAGSDLNIRDDLVLTALNKCSFLRSSERRLRILDARCAAGAFGRECATLGHEVIDIDISPKQVEMLNDETIPNMTAIVGDLEDISIVPQEYFDVVVCGSVLHHFPDFQIVLRNVYAWLRPGGRFFLVEPNGSNPVIRVSDFLGRILRIWLPDIRTENEKCYSLKTYIRALNGNGFSITFVDFYLPTRKDAPRTSLTILGVALLTREVLGAVAPLCHNE
jgi:2-polyprenyl-3-methyl-5-hydroxy-6-metoxy-1,4-benzoquinol methylase